MDRLAEAGLRAWQKGIGPLVPEDVYQRISEENPFRAFLAALGENVLVAEIENHVVGLAARENGDNHITDLWVDPDSEGLGAGSALLQTLETRLSAKGYRIAKIDVAAANARALSLYQHRGYEIDWQERRFDPILQIELDKIGLSKSL
ncbi:GNAT family N-acetyltransferase [Roseibium alexandrii]|uniref:GNAT family N-acetyltransferase n=1 Tax=Roseibium alexandrii TaxID=388408 RepID=UPI0001947CDA|nr:GNAT family N-acetyltransferase [Roseibium alexandrii]